MDDEFAYLEAELRALRPYKPSWDLKERVGREINSTAPAPARRGPAWTWAVLFPGVAAAVALLLGVVAPRWESPGAAHSARMTGASAAGGLKPVRMEKVLVEADDEGLVVLADGTQARRERLQYVDTVVWRNPRTNASLTWTVPREEVRVVPIVFQ